MIALTGLPGDLLGIALGIVFIVVAFVLPDRFVGKGAQVPAE
jgi:hypothetical protein